MNGGLCLCNICCSEDASETSEDSPPQSPAQNTKNREEELGEEYNQWCTSLIETEEYKEGLQQTSDQGCEFFLNEFRKVEKTKFGRIADDEYVVTGTKWEEIEERVEEGCECCMEWTSTGERSNDSCSNYEIDGDSNNISRVENDGEEDKYQDIGHGNWEFSAKESEAAMCEYEELVGSLHGDNGHMTQCSPQLTETKKERPKHNSQEVAFLHYSISRKI
ncbi:hypothetical protein BPAE_0156g00190 [Botrytis paeoniae]|uniref:Uncharacterized protein n=1 Tax=Botrytis paeoniae TaxID=278948 RepID=A0A4Z1FJF3_9HELO|nr:hypothetical protein BPAE_0156g00190 [Botrytis paeoniae]